MKKKDKKALKETLISFVVMAVLLLIVIFLLFSCSPEDVKKLPELEIGQEYDNGIIFYIIQEGEPWYVEGEQHGYIVSEEIGEYSWGCTNIDLSMFGPLGQANTSVIIAYCGHNNAAGETYVLGWWLPSIEEWELLIASNVLPNHTLNSYYWTSNKHSYPNAYCIRPSDSDINNVHVNTVLKILGIKRF